MNQEKRWNKDAIQKNLYIVLAIIGVVTIFYLNYSLINLQQELITMRQEVNQLQSSLSSQIAGISGNIVGIPTNIEESLKKENSIISDYSYQVQSDKIDRKEMTIPLNVTTRPKEHKVGLKTTFIIETKDGKTISTPGKEGEAYSYTASMVVPISDYLRLSVTFDDGTIQKSEKLEDMYQAFDGYIMRVEPGISLSSPDGELSTFSNNKIKFRGAITTTITASNDGSNYPISGEVQIVKNGKAIKKLPIQLETGYNTSIQTVKSTRPETTAAYMAGSCITYYTDLNEEVKYTKNDLIEIMVIVKDNYGYEFKQIVHSDLIDKEGTPNPTYYTDVVAQ